MEVRRHVHAPASAVWEQLARTACWPSWGPSVAGVDPADATVHTGMTGRVRTAVGVWLPFRITDVVDGVSWAWEVAGVNATTHRVEPRPDGSCDAVMGVPGWAPFYAPVCALGLRRIAAAAEADTTA